MHSCRRSNNQCNTNLNLCCGSALGQKSCAVVVPLVCFDLVNVTGVDGVTGSQDVDDVLRLRCRTLQPKRKCRQHNAAAVIKWPPSMDLLDGLHCACNLLSKAMRDRRGVQAEKTLPTIDAVQVREIAGHDGLIVTAANCSSHATE